MASERPATTRIVPAFFFNLDDGHWWEFKDKDTGNSARVECHGSTSPKTVRVTLGAELTEHVLAVTEAPDTGAGANLQYTLLESNVPSLGLFCKWQGGVVLPSEWTVGTSVRATSQPRANPGTGNAIEFTATLLRDGVFAPPAPALFGIEIMQVLKDVGLGSKLFEAHMYFAGSRGLVFAMGQKFGPSFVLHPTHWYGEQ